MCATHTTQQDNSLPAAGRIGKRQSFLDGQVLFCWPADMISCTIYDCLLLWMATQAMFLSIGYSTRPRLQVHKPAQANYRVAAFLCKTLLPSGLYSTNEPSFSFSSLKMRLQFAKPRRSTSREGNTRCHRFGSSCLSSRPVMDACEA